MNGSKRESRKKLSSIFLSFSLSYSGSVGQGMFHPCRNCVHLRNKEEFEPSERRKLLFFLSLFFEEESKIRFRFRPLFRHVKEKHFPSTKVNIGRLFSDVHPLFIFQPKAEQLLAKAEKKGQKDSHGEGLACLILLHALLYGRHLRFQRSNLMFILKSRQPTTSISTLDVREAEIQSTTDSVTD